MDHLTALKVFRQVVEQGGFAAASRQLRLSPAAVSKNIAELEAHVAARLLNWAGVDPGERMTRWGGDP